MVRRCNFMQEICGQMAIISPCYGDDSRPHILSSPATPGTARPCAAPLAARSSSGIFTGFDQLFAPHAHGYPVIGLVREGHRITECNRTRYRLGPGQLLALNAGDTHGCVQEGSHAARLRQPRPARFPRLPAFCRPHR